MWKHPFRINRKRIVHMPDKLTEHCLALFVLTLKVSQNTPFALSSDHGNLDAVHLTKPPAAANLLVILFKRMRRERNHVIAMLPVKTKTADFRLSHEPLDLARLKRQ